MGSVMCVPMKYDGRWLMGGGCVMCVPMKCDGRWLCGQCDVCAYEV